MTQENPDSLVCTCQPYWPVGHPNHICTCSTPENTASLTDGYPSVTDADKIAP